MGMTIKAELHYGYEIYYEDGGWLIAEAGEFGEFEPAWWDEDGDGTGEQITEQLMRAAGFTEAPGADGYWSRRWEAEKDLPVEVEHSGYEGGQLLLVVKNREFGAYAGESEVIDPAVMTSQADEAANALLADALRTLGITPNQSKPAWLLTCYYG